MTLEFKLFWHFNCCRHWFWQKGGFIGWGGGSVYI